MYADWESLEALPRHCFSCGRDLSMETNVETEGTLSSGIPDVQPPAFPPLPDSNENGCPEATDNGEHDACLCPAKDLPGKDCPQEAQQATVGDEAASDVVLGIGSAVTALFALSALLSVNDAHSGSIRP